jgi:hypothetical protein
MKYRQFLTEIQDIARQIGDIASAREVAGNPAAKKAADDLKVAVGSKDPRVVARARKITGLTPQKAIAAAMEPEEK